MRFNKYGNEIALKSARAGKIAFFIKIRYTNIQIAYAVLLTVSGGNLLPFSSILQSLPIANNLQKNARRCYIDEKNLS